LDGWPVIIPRAMAFDFVRSPPRWIFGVIVLDTFFPLHFERVRPLLQHHLIMVRRDAFLLRRIVSGDVSRGGVYGPSLTLVPSEGLESLGRTLVIS